MISAFFIRLGRFYARGSRESFPSQEATFQTLRALGWVPKTCIDIGAYHGDWAKMFRSIYPETKVLMIEAQEGVDNGLAYTGSLFRFVKSSIEKFKTVF